MTDCPLYKKKIVLNETDIVLHSDDFSAPVYYLKIKNASLGDVERRPKLEHAHFKQIVY